MDTLKSRIENPYRSPREDVEEANTSQKRTSSLWTIPAAFLFALALLLGIPGVGMTIGGPYSALEIAMRSASPFQLRLFWEGVIAFPAGVCLVTASGLLFGIGRKLMFANWRGVAILLAWLVAVAVVGSLVVGVFIQLATSMVSTRTVPDLHGYRFATAQYQ